MAAARKYDTEVRELAYSVWRDCGQSIDETARTLDSAYGYVIARKTLAAWRKKFGWDRRAAQAEAEERLLARNTSYPAILLDLAKRKLKYDDYLDGLPVGKIDSQVLFAYQNIINTIIKVKAQRDKEEADKIDRPRIFLENLEFVAMVLKEIDPQGLKVLSRNFDKLVARFKQVETATE